MRRVGVTLAATVLATMVIGSPVVAQQSQADIALRAAMELETVRGDLNGAIQQYMRIADLYRHNRPVAAEALWRLAACYQRLGDPRAQAAYERIVKEFPDQRDAVARARVGLRPTEAGAAGVIHRVVKTGRNIGPFTPSPDGRYLAFHNWDTNGNLAVHELATGLERDVTHNSPWQSDIGPSQFPVFTPDSKRILYTTRVSGVSELRIIGVDGTGTRTILRNAEYRYFSHHGISPDGKTVSALLALKDQTWQIALVSVDSGTVRVLKTVGWARPAVGNFSADGRWTVYSAPAQERTSGSHEVYSIATDGSAEFRLAPSVAATDATPYYSPDGSTVVFVGQRERQRVLWSVRVADGKPIAGPELLRTDVGAPMGFTANGSFYLRDDSLRIGVFTAKADPVTLRVSSPPTEVSSPTRQSSAVDPVWSPDGNLLAYSAPSESRSSETPYGVQVSSIYSKSATIVIRDRRSGAEREIVTRGGRLRGWSADGQSLVVDAGSGGVRTIEANTGRERVLVEREVGLPSVSITGTALFYYVRDSGASFEPGTRRPGVDTVRIMRRDAGSGKTTELCHLQAARGTVTDLAPSPDGRQVAFIALLPSEDARLFVVSASGGPPSEIPRPRGTLAGGFAWTGDSRAILFIREPETPAGGRQVWAVPIDGSSPYAVGIEAAGLYSLTVHPAGDVAFTATVREAGSVSVLENLLTPVKSAR